MKNKSIQPHCLQCKEPFWEDDLVITDTMFEQIQHFECFSFKSEYIKEIDTFGKIVKNHHRYKKVFLILKKGLFLH